MCFYSMLVKVKHVGTKHAISIFCSLNSCFLLNQIITEMFLFGFGLSIIRRLCTQLIKGSLHYGIPTEEVRQQQYSQGGGGSRDIYRMVMVKCKHNSFINASLVQTNGHCTLVSILSHNDSRTHTKTV